VKTKHSQTLLNKGLCINSQTITTINYVEILNLIYQDLINFDVTKIDNYGTLERHASISEKRDGI
jgi:uncharacterized membrane protein YcgQ (UPF0703/DUF1980 family)